MRQHVDEGGAGESRITFMRLLMDIRSERALRLCCIYACCLAIFFFYNYNVEISNVGVFSIPSKMYFSIILIFGTVPIGMHYSIGFFFLSYQAFIIVVVIAGIILTPTVTALTHSVWAGYLVISGSFSLLVGPVFGAVEPIVLHCYAFAAAIFVEFMYTPAIQKFTNGKMAKALTIDNLWKYAITNILVNIGLYIGITCAAMLLPPWRSARSQLHEKAHYVLTLLAKAFEAEAKCLSDLGEKETMEKEGQDPGKVVREHPEIDISLLVVGHSSSRDSIQELSAMSMLEPSFLHPGTLSAHPDAWKVFVVMVQDALLQSELLHKIAKLVETRSSAKVSSTALKHSAEAAKACSRLVTALAAALQYERRGSFDWPPSAFGKADTRRSREDLLAEIKAVQAEGTEAVKKLGASLFSPKAGGASPDILSVLLFVTLCKALRQTSEAPPKPLSNQPAVRPLVPYGLWGLTDSVVEIQKQLSLVSLGNLAMQLLISGGLLQTATYIKSLIKGLAVIFTPWRMCGAKRIWHQPVHIYYTLQFLVGVWGILSASSFWDGMRNWQDTGGHGSTWPLMAFLLVLQPTYEATIQKGTMRILATVAGVLLGWGLFSVSSHPGWLIPISTLVVAFPFWLLPDSRSCVQLKAMGDLQYLCIAFSFCYTMVMGYSNVYGGHATAVTRLATQVLGSVFAIVVSLVVFPVSGVATATAAAVESLAEMEEVALILQKGVLDAHLPDDGPSAQTIMGMNEHLPVMGGTLGFEIEETGIPKGQGLSSIQWDKVQDALGRSEVACSTMLSQLASVQAYPLSVTLAKACQGNAMHVHICNTSPKISKALKVMRRAASELERLSEIVTAAKSLSITATKPALIKVQKALAAQMVELADGICFHRHQLCQVFMTRSRLLPLPYMPVSIRNEDISDKGVSERRSTVQVEATAMASDRKANGHTRETPAWPQVATPSMNELLHALAECLEVSVTSVGGNLESELQSYLEGKGSLLAIALDNFHLAYLLPIQMELHNSGSFSLTPQPTSTA